MRGRVLKILSIVVVCILISTAIPRNSLVAEVAKPRVVEMHEDWVVVEDELQENVTIVLNGNLLIQGNLTLSNATLKINCTVDEQYKLNVTEQGKLIIENSIITNDPGKYYGFEVYGKLVMNSSKVSYADSIKVYSDSTIVTNSTISNCRMGIHCKGSSPVLINNQILSNDVGLYFDFLTSYNLKLYPGWNLIALPFTNSTYSAALLAGLIEECKLYKWDYFEQKYINYSSEGDIDFKISAYDGVWIKLNEDKELSLQGKLRNRREIGLYEGLNVVSTPNEKSNVSEFFGKLAGVEVYKWSAESQKFVSWLRYCDDFFGSDFRLEPEYGYLVYAKEDCVVEYEGVVDPIVERNAIAENGQGIRCSGVNLTLRNCSLRNDLNFYLDSDSHIVAENTYFKKDNVTVKDISDLIVRNTVEINVIEERDKPLPDVIVSIEDWNGNLVLDEFTDSYGRVSTSLVYYSQNSSGLRFHTPHVLHTQAGNEVNVIAEGRKNLTIWYGNDSDNDYIPDSLENIGNAYWFDAAAHAYYNQTKYDYYGSISRVAGRGIDTEILNETFLPIAAGKYRFGVRARGLYNTTLRISAWNTSSKLIEEEYLLTNEWGWYFSAEFETSADLIKLGAWDLADNLSVYLDKIVVAPIKITDPLDYDTDKDRILDGLELSYYIEAENLASSIKDRDASNAKSVKLQMGEGIELEKELFGEHTLYVRARCVDAGNLEFFVNSALIGTSNLTDRYEWYTFKFNRTGNFLLNLTSGAGEIYVDKLFVLRNDEVFVNEFSDGFLYKNFSFPGEYVANICVPNSKITLATLELYGQAEVTPVVNTTNNEQIPDIYGNDIVYEVGGDIYCYNTSTKDRKQIVSGTSAMTPAIWGDKIVWVDHRYGNPDIFMYDLTKKEESTITTNPSTQWEPDIYEDKIVWMDYRNGNWDIYLYDLSTSTEMQITTDWKEQSFPAIYGSKIVWHDYRNGNWDIYMYDLSLAAEKWFELEWQKPEIRITLDDDNQMFPDLYGDKIVWADDRNANLDIYLYDLSKGKEKRITKDSAEQSQARIHGDKIVWRDYRNGNWDVYLYDLSADAERRITFSTQDQFLPAIYGDTIVWQDYRAGNWDIYWVRQRIELDVGNDAHVEINYSELAGKRMTTINLAGEFNKYLETQTGDYVDIPIKVYSPHNGSLNLSNINIIVGFLTDQFDRDTDGDGLWDGDEIFGFYGYDILETEDAVELQEWEHSPFNFIHQTGVTLTSSNYYANDTDEDFESSWIKLRFKIEHSSNYRLVVQPNFELRSSVVVEQIRSRERAEVRISRVPGKNVRVTPQRAVYLSKVLENATYIVVRREGCDLVKAENVEISAYISEVKVENGKAHILTRLGYLGEYNFSCNTSYEITLGIDLGRVPAALLPGGSEFPAELPWDNLTLLQIIDLDYIRIERQSLDPLSIDADKDSLLDCEELGFYPLNPDADGDGLNDSVEFRITHTNPGYRDTDYDGIRDGVELGYTADEISGMHGELASAGSWLERIAHWRNPYNYTPINNWDADFGATTTDPFDTDTDDDGLPDGWTDGWVYNPGYELRTYYTNDNREEILDYWRYDERLWGQGGEVDNIVQIYEGEDLNLDGAYTALYDPGFKWGFYEDTFEPKQSWTFTPQGLLPLYGETNPNSTDSDVDLSGFSAPDGIPDGYEVWYSHLEPFKNSTGAYFLDPTNPYDANLDSDVEHSCFETQEATEPKDFEINASVIARAQRFTITETINLARVDVNLNLDNCYGLVVELELWEAAEKGKPPNKTADKKLTSLNITGGAIGWYPFDIKDQTLKIPKDFFIILNFSWELDYKWLGSNVSDGESYYFENNAWEKTNYNLDFKLYTYNEVGDNLTNLHEYIVCTNPKNPNTDNILLGCEVFDDNLRDGDEVGYLLGNDPTTNHGGIIFRTNVKEGALKFDNYGVNNTWINYDGDGKNAQVTGRNYTFSEKVENPLVGFSGASSENILLFTLKDDTKIYLSKTRDKLYVWSPGVDLEAPWITPAGKEYYRGTCYVHAFNTTVNMAGYVPEIAYRNQELYLSDPFDWDTDDDGIGDGAEIEWDKECERNRAGNLVSTDTLINVRDRDSDDDGLEDMQELNWSEDCETTFGWPDGDGLKNMIDPDSDNDYIWDGDELRWWDDTDKDGLKNMVDPDSDNDGLPDGWADGWKYNEALADFEFLSASYNNAFDPWEGEDWNRSGLNELAEPSPILFDSDRDGLWDGYDISGNYGELTTRPPVQTSPTQQMNRDTDGDGLTDWQEVYGWWIKWEDWISYDAWLANQSIKPTIHEVHVVSDPNSNDTDGDGILDNIEYWFTNATNKDTDFDGLLDSVEDANKNGRVDANESNPLDRDYDDDFLCDGWNDDGNGVRDSDEYGEDVNGNGIIELNDEPDPLKADTDEDKILDGVEYKYINRLGQQTKYADSDNDGLINLIDSDSDNDGLLDGEENFDYDAELDTSPVVYWTNYTNDTKYPVEHYIETDPTDPDSDDDGLYDGAEPVWSSDKDGDGYINAWDQDTNDQANNGPSDAYTLPGGDGWTCADENLPPETKPPEADTTNNYDPWDDCSYYEWERRDYKEVFVVFRASAEDANNDGKLDYTEGTWIAVDPTSDLYYNVNSIIHPNQLDLSWTSAAYIWSGVETSEPTGLNRVQVFYGANPGDNPEDLLTPDGYEVYYQSANNRIYLKLSASSYIRYTKPTAEPAGYEDSIYSIAAPHNFVALHQETYDPRPCLNLDLDFDGLTNGLEDYLGLNKYDADTDNDGIRDGNEIDWDKDTDGDGLINALDPDSDNDGILDGVELGKVVCHRDTYRNFNPTTNTYYDAFTIFFAEGEAPDKDPSTTTLVLVADSDGDRLSDGYEDSNYNGKVDSGELDPNDVDSDDDGLVDGDEVLDIGTNPLNHDSDNDGIYDGTELGLTFEKITPDTNLSRGHFVPDADPTTKTNATNVDSDGDGINDGAEDKDCNGKLDYNETRADYYDTDGDGLWDGHDIIDQDSGKIAHRGELSTHYLDPSWIDYPYGHSDVPAGTPVQAEETDPKIPDTDGDGLLDGTTGELKLYHTAVTNQTEFTDPSKLDTDDDGLSDGQEVSGWIVTIIWEKTKEKKKAYNVYSNPTDPDTDNDNLNDYDEFINGADPNSHDTDGDKIFDWDEVNGDNPSSPCAIEGDDPTLKNLDVSVDVDWGSFLGVPYVEDIDMVISIDAADNAGLDYITFKISGQNPKTVYFEDDVKSKRASVEFDIDILKSLFSGYDLEMVIYDVNGNGAKSKEHIDSILESIAKAILAALIALAKAIIELVSAIFEWIWGVIEAGFNAVIKPITDAISDWAKGIVHAVEKSFSGILSGEDGVFSDKEAGESIGFAILTGGFVIAIIVLLTVLLWVEILTTPFTAIVKTLTSSIVDFVIPIIMTIIIASLAGAGVYYIAEQAKKGEDKDSLISKALPGWESWGPIAGLATAVAGAIAQLLIYFETIIKVLTSAMIKELRALVCSIIGLTLCVFGGPLAGDNVVLLGIVDGVGLALSIYGVYNLIKETGVDVIGMLGGIMKKVGSLCTVLGLVLTIFTIIDHGWQQTQEE